MAILALGGPTKVEISSSGSGGLAEIPAVLSTDLSYDNASVTMADGRQIKAGTTVTLTVETLDLLETGGWFAVTETMLNTPFAATPSDYQAKITMKDDGTATFDGIRVAGLDFVAGADGEYSRWVVSFNATGVDVLDVLTLST